MKVLVNTKISYLVIVPILLAYHSLAADLLPKANFKGYNPSDIVAKTESSSGYVVYAGELTQTRKMGKLISWLQAGTLISKV